MFPFFSSTVSMQCSTLSSPSLARVFPCCFSSTSSHPLPRPSLLRETVLSCPPRFPFEEEAGPFNPSFSNRWSEWRDPILCEPRILFHESPDSVSLRIPDYVRDPWRSGSVRFAVVLCSSTNLGRTTRRGRTRQAGRARIQTHERRPIDIHGACWNMPGYRGEDQDTDGRTQKTQGSNGGCEQGGDKPSEAVDERPGGPFHARDGSVPCA